MILALAGGVGGAKLAHGLDRVLPPGSLHLVVNTGDDFDHLGLRICPDLDTALYTLSGQANPETGWGIAGETWSFMDALARLGGETWFRLGDRDLATHVERTRRLRQGERLREVIAAFALRFRIGSRIEPMTDHRVSTVLSTDEGELPFQEYFVRRRCEPRVRGVRFEGAERAEAGPWLDELRSGLPRAVVLCPSNPHLSIDPILSLPGVMAALRESPAPVLAVSPIIGGEAVKGPAAKIMRELGGEASVVEVARHYRGIVDLLVIDVADRDLGPRIEEETGVRVAVRQTLMGDERDRCRLAREVLELADALPTPARPPGGQGPRDGD